MNLANLEADVYQRCNITASPPTAVKTRIDSFINQRHRQILAMPGISRLRDDKLTFASVASQPTYALGPAISRVKDIYDGTTNELKLDEHTLAWLRTVDPGLTTTGTPTSWVPLSIKQVQSQPAAACNLHVISTDAGDVGTCFVEYTRSGGYRASASAVMTGLADKALTTTTDVVEVDKFYLSTAAIGTITLLDALAGNVLATIKAGQTYGRFVTLQLWPTPAAVVTYSVDYTREIADMSNATDEPLLPPDFHYLVSLGARVDEYEHAADSRLAVAQAQWVTGIRHLTNYVINSPDYLIVPGGLGDSGGSNLGAMYPEGRW